MPPNPNSSPGHPTPPDIPLLHKNSREAPPHTHTPTLLKSAPRSRMPSPAWAYSGGNFLPPFQAGCGGMGVTYQLGAPLDLQAPVFLLMPAKGSKGINPSPPPPPRFSCPSYPPGGSPGFRKPAWGGLPDLSEAHTSRRVSSCSGMVHSPITLTLWPPCGSGSLTACPS